MAATGTFGTLPYHMVKQTIGYIVEQTNEIDVFSFDETEDNVFYPLLHVCRSWRTVALSIMLAGCDVTLDCQVKFAYHSVEDHACIASTLNNTYNMYVTTVYLSINFTSILDGSVAAQLEAETAKHITFQRAYTLCVKLTIEDVCGSATEYVQNMDRTLACLANMFPAISKVTVIIKDCTKSGWKTDSLLLAPMMDFFTKDKTDVIVEFDSDRTMNTINNCQNINNITFLECNWDDNYAATAQLIHQNAQSLLSLTICYHTVLGFEYLFFNNQKEEIVYPHLIDLDLKKTCTQTMSPLALVYNNAPFPKLKYLYIMFEYPFRDDLPFRGNRSSLLKLGLYISPRTIRLMNEFPISTSLSMRKFEKLLLADASEAPEIPEDDVSTYTEFINMHLPTVKYLFLNGQGISSLLHSSLYSTIQYANITQVTLIGGSHSFAQIARVLRLFPELKKLVCRISSMGDEFKDMGIQEIYNHLKSNDYMRHSHLQTWNSRFLEGISPTITCDTILLLADMCPYLKNISFNMEKCESLENVYSKIAYSGTYSKFREQMNPRLEFSLEQFSKCYFVRIRRRHIA